MKETRMILSYLKAQKYLNSKYHRQNKDEMHHPLKHIIITPSGPVLIDFERCKETKKPKNVTQFVEFLCRIKEELSKKGILINAENLRKLSKEYKNNICLESLESIKKELV